MGGGVLYKEVYMVNTFSQSIFYGTIQKNTWFEQ